MGKKIGADDTLIITVIIEDYALDHMIAEHRFHPEDHWAVGVENGAVGDFDFATYWELKRLPVECAFD
uniref:Uncharacterized protein n=1 Tax=Romanomermis culicivorax TaxID=13658 RepID=A0A915I4Z0_ROMCU